MTTKDGGEATSKKSQEGQPANTSTSASASAPKDARSSKKRRRPAPGSWSCPDDKCDTLNSARRTECKVCGAAKPGTELEVGFGAPRPSRGRSTTRTEQKSAASDGMNTGTSNDRKSRSGDGGSSSGIPSADERPKVDKSSADGKHYHHAQKSSAENTNTPPPPTHKATSEKGSGRKRPAPGSWPCPLCQTLNSARRERCKACNKLKPEDGGGVMLEGFGSRTSSGRGSMSDSDHEDDRKKLTHGTSTVSSSGGNRSRSRSMERRRRHNHQSRSRSIDGDRHMEYHRSRSRSTDREPYHRTSTSSSKRWTCSACTLHNSNKRTRCKACRTPREGEGDSTSKRQDSVHSHHDLDDRHRREKLRRSRSKDSVLSSSDHRHSKQKRPHRSRSTSRDGDDNLRRQESKRRNTMKIEGQQLSDSSGDNADKGGGDKANDKIAEDRSTSATHQRRKVSMDLFLSSPADTEEDTGKSKGKKFATGLLRRAGLKTDENLRIDLDDDDGAQRTKLTGSNGEPTKETSSDVVTTDAIDDGVKQTQKTSRRTKSRSPSPFRKEKKNPLSRSESRRKQSHSKSRRDGGAKSRERSRRSESRGGREKSTSRRRRRSHHSKSPSSRDRSKSPKRSNLQRSHHSRSRSPSRERRSNRRRSHHSRSPSRKRKESRIRSSRRRSHHSRSLSRSRSRSFSPDDRKKPSRRESMGRSKSDGRRLRSSYRRSKSGRKSRHRSRSVSLSSGTKRSEVEKAVSNVNVAAPSALEIANAVLEKEAESSERKTSLPKSGSKCDLYLLHSMVTDSPSAAAADGKASSRRGSIERRASIDHITLAETSKPQPSTEGGTANRRASFGGSASFSMMDLAGLDTTKRRASMELAATYKSEQVLTSRTASRRASISIVPSVASNGEKESDKNLQRNKANRHASMDFVPASWTATNVTEPADKSSSNKIERRPAPGSWSCPKEECGKFNSARRKECKVCGASKPKRDADKRRSKSRRSKGRRRHRSKSKSRKKSRAKRRESGDDTDSNGSKSDGEYNDLKQAATAIATTGAAATTTATAQAAAADSPGDTASNSEKKGVDSKQVAGKDADNSTGTSTTAASSPQSSSKTNDEEEQKQLLDKEDGVQMTSRVDRRSAMRGSRVRRSMMALFDSNEEIVVLTPATLESNFVSTIRQKTRGPAKYAAFSSAFFVVVLVVLLAAFFDFAPLPDVPIWQPVLAIGNQLIESIIETTLYIMAVYLILKKGAVLAMYFVRHCGLYVGMVCIAYTIADISLLVKYGSGGADDGGERWARVALSACLGVSSMTAAVLLQGRICTRIELRALNSVTGETDDEIALYLKKDRHLTPDEMRKKREGIKDWYHRTMYIAVLGYQVLAVMIPLASAVWYLINDVGSLTEFNLCRYTTSRCVDITIRPNALVEKDVEISWDLQSGTLILSMLESIGAFSHDAFVLATFSKAALFPNKPGSVGIAAFVAFGKLSLAIGYLINLLLLWTSDSLAEGLVWSMCFAFLDIACASLVLVACFRFTPTLRRAWQATVSDNEADDLSDSSHKRLGCKTLRSIAFSAQQLLNPQKKKWAKALFIATLSVFLLDSLQGILVLIETTKQFGNTYIAETFKFSMHICLFYAFVNFFSVSDRGKHFYKSRRAMGAIAICGILIRSWQMAQMVVQSEKLVDVKPTTGTDKFVQSILAFDVVANLALLISAFAISDLDLSQKSTRRLSKVEYAPVAVESGDARVDTRTQLLLAKMVEGDLRQRARNVFCLYLISVWIYSMSLAIFDGLISGTAPYLTATFDHTLDNMLAASVALTDTMNQQEMTGRRSLYAITPRLRPFVFVLALSRPGLEIFFHYGLVFSIFCFDGLRKKPRKRYSLVTAGTFAFHAFALLLVFLIAMTYSSITSSDAVADYNNVGDDDAMQDEGTISGLVGVASGFVTEAQEDHSAAEIIPFLCLVIWFMFLIPMAVTLHMLWKGRRRIHNIVSGGEAPQNTDRRKSGGSACGSDDVDLEAAIATDIETRALLTQPADIKDNDKEGAGTSMSEKSSNNEGNASEVKSMKEDKDVSRSRKSKRSSTKKERRKEGDHAEPSQKKSSKTNDKESRLSKRKHDRRRSSTLEADSADEDRDRDGNKKSRSSKKNDRRRSSTLETESKDVSKARKTDRRRSSTLESENGDMSTGKTDGGSKESKNAAAKVDRKRGQSRSRKSRGGSTSRSKSRGQSRKRKDKRSSTKRDATMQSKLSKDDAKNIDDAAVHASSVEAKDPAPDTTSSAKPKVKPESLVETKQPEKKDVNGTNEAESNEKEALGDAKEEKKEEKADCGESSLPGAELV